MSGYTITRGRLSSAGIVKIGIFIACYSFLYCTLFIYESRVRLATALWRQKGRQGMGMGQAFDPAEVLYLYDSPGGYGILVLGLVGWAWFCRAIYTTLLHYPEKRGFYLRFCFFFSIWSHPQHPHYPT